MPTSSKNPTVSRPNPLGDHWLELSATLSVETKESFSAWLDSELESLESDLAKYVTKNSLAKSLRR